MRRNAQGEQDVVVRRGPQAQTDNPLKLVFLRDQMVRGSDDDVCQGIALLQLKGGIGHAGSCVAAGRLGDDVGRWQFGQLCHALVCVVRVRDDVNIFGGNDARHSAVGLLKQTFTGA